MNGAVSYQTADEIVAKDKLVIRTGFRSVRCFNAAFVELYGRAPSSLRLRAMTGVADPRPVAVRDGAEKPWG
jgi:hypothetical protein